MPNPGCYKDIEESPLLGLLDLRSPNGTLTRQDYRLVFNITLNEQKARCRGGGWKRLFADSQFGFKNQDLHDQLQNCQQFYDEFNFSYFFPGGLTGTQYLNFVPGYTVPGDISVSSYGEYCGYSWDSGFESNPAIRDELVMIGQFYGYPFVTLPSDPSAPCNTGAPYFYPTSYYGLMFTHQAPDTEVADYQSGPVQVFTAPYETNYSYCGTTLWTRVGCRESITMLGQVTSENEARKLIAATKTRIYALNETTGNWRILADGLGGPYATEHCECSPRRFKMDTLGGYAFFTNDYDPVLQWRFDNPTSGCNLWSADYVEDLLGLGILKAKVIVGFEGFLLVANVEQDGVQRPFRIFWSDFNNPTSFIPGAESLAGFTDLGIGESILAMEKIGGSLRVYTNQSIYRVTFVGGELIFAFTKIYSGPNILAYPNSIANSGDTHYYMANDSIYRLTESDRSPVLIEWIHKAAGAIYKGVDGDYLKSFSGIASFGPINTSACDNAIGYYRKDTDEVYFSWPTGTSECATHTLRLNVRYIGADIIDHGFSAFTEFTPDAKITIADWLIDQQICNWSEFAGEMVKEGAPYDPADSVFDNPPPFLINETEDPSLPTDPNSWCAQLGEKTLEDFCRDCETKLIFIGASALDKTLKEFDPEIFYRERYIDLGQSYECPETVPGNYVQDGYVSLMQSDLHDYGVKEDKVMERMAIDFDALPQTTPGTLEMQVGYAANARCALWSEIVSKEFTCPTDATDAEHLAANTRPNELSVFKVFRRGRYLSWRFSIAGTGSAGCFTKQTLRMRKVQGKWP